MFGPTRPFPTISELIAEAKTIRRKNVKVWPFAVMMSMFLLNVFLFTGVQGRSHNEWELIVVGVWGAISLISGSIILDTKDELIVEKK